jgi:predicted PurR-regulated permease PerM
MCASDRASLRERQVSGDLPAHSGKDDPRDEARIAEGIPYSFLLGAFLGAMTWVPVLGLFVGLAPVVVVGLGAGKSPTWLVLCGLAVGAVWLVQVHFITPKVVGHRLQLNFLASYLAFFAGGLLWGAWGMILSIPLLGVIRIACAASPRLQPWAFAIGKDNDHGVPTT